MADAAFQVARLKQELGEYGPAKQALERSYFAAQESGYDAAALDAASQLVYLLSFHMSKNDDALEWGRHASAGAQRLGGAGPMRGRVLLNISTALEQKGEYAATIKTSKRAIEELARIHGDSHADIALALTRLGSAQALGGEPKEAVLTLEKAVAAAEAVFGPAHRKLHRPLAELGQALSPLGRNAEAIAVQVRALKICEASFGPRHVNTGFAELNLGVAFYYANKLQEARVHFERASEIVEENLGPDHRDTALCLSALALTISEDRPRAAAINRRLIKIFEKQGQDHVDVAMASINLADVLVRMGEFDEAFAAAHRARTIFEASDTNDSRQSAAHYLEGKALIGLRRYPEAVIVLSECVRLREKPGMSPALFAQAQFGLAQALLPTRRGDALKLGRQALHTYEGLGEDQADTADEVRRWLQAR